MKSAAILGAVGRALYGAQWQTALARELGVSDRTMRRWVAGVEPPPTIWADARAALERRGIVLKETLALLPA